MPISCRGSVKRNNVGAIAHLHRSVTFEALLLTNRSISVSPQIRSHRLGGTARPAFPGLCHFVLCCYAALPKRSITSFLGKETRWVGAKLRVL